VQEFRASSAGFAAQLYTDGEGRFRIAIRGTDEPFGDIFGADRKLALGAWHAQLDDARVAKVAIEAVVPSRVGSGYAVILGAAFPSYGRPVGLARERNRLG